MPDTAATQPGLRIQRHTSALGPLPCMQCQPPPNMPDVSTLVHAQLPRPDAEPSLLQLDVTQRKSTALKRLLACMPIHPGAMDARADLLSLDRQRKLLAASGELCTLMELRNRHYSNVLDGQDPIRWHMACNLHLSLGGRASRHVCACVCHWLDCRS